MSNSQTSPSLVEEAKRVKVVDGSQSMDVPLQRLLDLIRDMYPFLDCQGGAYCYAKADEGAPEVITRLDGEITRSLLNYRYFVAHDQLPSRSEINQALNLTRGALWHKRPPQVALKPHWAATIRAIVKSVQINGDFLGSASKAGDLLRKVGRTDTEIITALPRSDDQLGIVLSRIGLLLRSKNIELFRPPRRDKERLWCWRLLTPGYDTSDTTDSLSPRASGSSEGSNEDENPLDDSPDTFDDQLRTLHEIQQGVVN